MLHLARSDVALDRTYQALIADLKREAGTPLGAREPESVHQLRVAQRAWLVYRDTECRRRNLGKEGPLWAPVRAACLAEFSGAHAEELAKRSGTQGRMSVRAVVEATNPSRSSVQQLTRTFGPSHDGGHPDYSEEGEGEARQGTFTSGRCRLRDDWRGSGLRGGGRSGKPRMFDCIQRVLPHRICRYFSAKTATW